MAFFPFSTLPQHQGHSGAKLGVPSDPSALSRRGSRNRRSVRRHRKIFTGTEEVAVAHARAVMDLVSDLARGNADEEGAASCSADPFAANDYVLQIQVRVGQTDSLFISSSLLTLKARLMSTFSYMYYSYKLYKNIFRILKL